MRFDKGLSAVAALVGLVSLLGGCSNNFNRHEVHASDSYVQAPSNTISVYQLASRLNCQVTKASGACATLQSRTNSVTVFSDPGGAIYVNGQPVDRRGQIAEVSGTIFVADNVDQRIRPLLRPEPAPMYPPRPMPPTRMNTVQMPAGLRPVLPMAMGGVVVIDAGHGGKDPGCIGCNGAQEKDIVLAIALEVRRHLMDNGVKVIMTRADDEFIELDRRAEIANQNGADLFVAIHVDSATRNPAATGHTVYVAPGASGEVMAMARVMDRDMEQHGLASRGVRHAAYRVLVKTSCPSMLVEVGYSSNRGEAARLGSASYRSQIAVAISEGILDALRQR